MASRVMDNPLVRDALCLGLMLGGFPVSLVNEGVYALDVPNKGEEDAPKPTWKPTDIEFHQARLRCHQLVARDWQMMKIAMPELDWKILSGEQHSVVYAKQGEDEYLADLTNESLSGYGLLKWARKGENLAEYGSLAQYAASWAMQHSRVYLPLAKAASNGLLCKLCELPEPELA